MRSRTKLALYGLVLAALFGGGAAIGAVVGPIDLDGEPPVTTPGDWGIDHGHGHGAPAVRLP